MLLKELTALRGVSGDETDVRNFIRVEAAKYAEVTVDRMGNVIAHKAGNGPKIMIDAHMDEVGLMITGIEGDGTLSFASVGSIDARVLVSKRVKIGKDNFPGIIGAKAIHLQSAEERRSPLGYDQLYIDIGTKSEDEAKKHVKLGDIAVFAGDYIEFGDNKVKSRALDDRAGCALALQALAAGTDADIYACFSVKEEVGGYGALTAARHILPDLAIILEGTTCADMAYVDDKDKITTLGDGPVISIMDSSAIPSRDWMRFIVKTAEDNGIPFQYRRGAVGGTDAGYVQRAGVKVANISVPCRYIHSPASVMDKRDFENAGKLLVAVLNNAKNFDK